MWNIAFNLNKSLYVLHDMQVLYLKLIQSLLYRNWNQNPVWQMYLTGMFLIFSVFLARFNNHRKHGAIMKIISILFNHVTIFW